MMTAKGPCPQMCKLPLSRLYIYGQQRTKPKGSSESLHLEVRESLFDPLVFPLLEVFSIFCLGLNMVGSSNLGDFYHLRGLRKVVVCIIYV